MSRIWSSFLTPSNGIHNTQTLCNWLKTWPSSSSKDHQSFNSRLRLYRVKLGVDSSKLSNQVWQAHGAHRLNNNRAWVVLGISSSSRRLIPTWLVRPLKWTPTKQRSNLRMPWGSNLRMTWPKRWTQPSWSNKWCLTSTPWTTNISWKPSVQLIVWLILKWHCMSMIRFLTIKLMTSNRVL